MGGRPGDAREARAQARSGRVLRKARDGSLEPLGCRLLVSFAREGLGEVGEEERLERGLGGRAL